MSVGVQALSLVRLWQGEDGNVVLFENDSREGIGLTRNPVLFILDSHLVLTLSIQSCTWLGGHQSLVVLERLVGVSLLDWEVSWRSAVYLRLHQFSFILIASVQILSVLASWRLVPLRPLWGIVLALGIIDISIIRSFRVLLGNRVTLAVTHCSASALLALLTRSRLPTLAIYWILLNTLAASSETSDSFIFSLSAIMSATFITKVGIPIRVTSGVSTVASSSASTALLLVVHLLRTLTVLSLSNLHYVSIRIQTVSPKPDMVYEQESRWEYRDETQNAFY